MAAHPDEPDTNEPIPTPSDDTGMVSGDDGVPGAMSDEPAPDPMRDQEPTAEPTSPADLPSPEVDPDAERDPTGEGAPGDPPADLDDGPLVAMNANLPEQG